MAFREDADALHARIESLERELAQAREEIDRLRPLERERDRLQRELDALRPKKQEPRKPARDLERATASAARRNPGSSFGPRAALAAMVAVLGLGLLAWALAANVGSRGGEALAEKPPDTRAPSIGVVDLVATPDPVPIPFVATGTDDAPSGCSGYLPDAPQLVLRTSQPTLVTITTRCGIDLVAVLSGAPAGLLCDDDGGQANQPRIQTVLAAGEARLTIGTYASGAQASCEIELHAAPLPADVAPNGLAAGGTPRLGVATLEGAQGTEVAYEGALADTILEAARVQSGCVGRLAPVPDLALEITEPTIARIDTISQGDLVLVMQNLDGTFTCDDDDGMGNAPRIAKRLAPGRYPVWVGRFADDAVPLTFHVGVRLTTLASEAASAPATTDLVDGPPLRLTGTAGDELSASSMWSDCAVPGYVRYEPDHTFRLAARRDVTIVSARMGGSAPLLAIASHERAAAAGVSSCTADGAWRGTLDAGTYDLYVGVSSGDVVAGPFELTLAAAPPSVLPYAP